MLTSRFDNKHHGSIFNKIRNWMNGNRIKRYADKLHIHEGTTQILKYGVWEDSEHNIYNCMGEKVGKIIWFNREES